MLCGMAIAWCQALAEGVPDCEKKQGRSKRVPADSAQRIAALPDLRLTLFSFPILVSLAAPMRRASRRFQSLPPVYMLQRRGCSDGAAPRL